MPRLKINQLLGEIHKYISIIYLFGVISNYKADQTQDSLP